MALKVHAPQRQDEGYLPLRTVRHVSTLRSHTERVSGLAWHPQATQGLSPTAANLVSGGCDSVAKLWPLEGSEPVGELKGHPGWAKSGLASAAPATSNTQGCPFARRKRQPSEACRGLTAASLPTCLAGPPTLPGTRAASHVSPSTHRGGTWAQLLSTPRGGCGTSSRAANYCCR